MASRGSASFATKADVQAVKADVQTVKDDIRAVGVAVERMESMMRGLAEGLVATRDELKADIRSLEEKLSARIAVLEKVVRQNSRDIQKSSEGIRKNSQDVEALRQEVVGLRRDFERRDGKLEGLDERVTAVEKRVGIARE